MTTLAEALAPRSDQLNADDLIPGPRVLKITGARIAKDGREIKVVISFEGDNGKPWKPCKTMGRAMVMVWAITEPEQFVGKSVRVYRDPEVRFGDQGEVGGIRISHMSHIAQPAKAKLTVSQGKKALFTFHPLVTDATDKPDEVTVWALNLIKRLEAAPTAEALVAITEEGIVIKRRQYLADTKPELAKLIDAAIAAGPVAEGRDDADHGDGFPGDDTTSEQEGN